MKERERPSASASPFPTLSPRPLSVSATWHSSCRWDRLSPPLISLSVRLPSLFPAVRMGGCPSWLNRTPSSQAVEASCAASHPEDAGHRHSGRQPDGVLRAQAPPRCHRRAAAQAVSPVKGPLANRREVPSMLTVSWTPQIRNDDRAPPVSLGARVCHRAPLTAHVHACTRMPTSVHTHAQGRTHALQADSSHGSPLWPVLGAAPVPLASFTNSPLCPSTLLTPPWEEGLCLPSTPEPIRLPTHTGQIPSWDPHKLQRPRSYLETFALQGVQETGLQTEHPGHREHPPHRGTRGGHPEKAQTR